MNNFIPMYSKFKRNKHIHTKMSPAKQMQEVTENLNILYPLKLGSVNYGAWVESGLWSVLHSL